MFLVRKTKRCVFTYNMARFIEIVMGVGIAAGTVIEDFGTGGVGIADDLASFLIAKKLILGY